MRKARKKPKCNLPILILSIVCAYFVTGYMERIFGYTIGAGGAAGNILWHVLFFVLLFIGGFVGMNLGMLASVKYRIKRRSFWMRSFVIAAVLIMVVSAVGEFLFSITMETTSEIAETLEGVDIVLLIDGSGNLGKSDSDYGVARTQAVTDFVESLGEETHLQVIVFAATILPEQTDMLTMNDAGKAEVIDCVSSINSVGKTNFDDAFEAALDSLKSDGRSDANQLIILLTDGDGTLSDTITEECVNSGVTLCTVRTTNSPKSDEGQAVATLAEQTGGVDTVISLGTDGSAEASKMTLAFTEAVNTATNTESNQSSHIKLSDERLVGSVHTSLYQFVIRTITLSVLMILFGYGYFGKVTSKGAVRELPGAVVLSVLVTIFGTLSIMYILYMLFLGSAFVTLEVDDGKDLKFGENDADAANAQKKPLESDEGDVIDV